MTTCQNCNTALGCSCQIRTASDGKQVCSNCISSYEDQIAALKTKSLSDLDKITLKTFTT